MCAFFWDCSTLCKRHITQHVSRTLLEVGNVLRGEGDADAVHLLDLALGLGAAAGSLVGSRHLRAEAAGWGRGRGRWWGTTAEEESGGGRDE